MQTNRSMPTAAIIPGLAVAVHAAAPVTHPYGERQYAVRDPAGHVWVFSETVADVDPRDWGGALAAP